MFIKNWRPIMLLNTDCKIVVKALANGVKPILHKIIHPSEKGFIAGRSKVRNLRKIMDIIDFTEKEKVAAVLISLDFEKVFKRVERQS